MNKVKVCEIAKVLFYKLGLFQFYSLYLIEECLNKTNELKPFYTSDLETFFSFHSVYDFFSIIIIIISKIDNLDWFQLKHTIHNNI